MSLKDLQERKKMLECELRNVERAIKDALPERDCHIWSSQEEDRLVTEFGGAVYKIASSHKRTEGAIIERLKRLVPRLRSGIWPPPHKCTGPFFTPHNVREYFGDDGLKHALEVFVEQKARVRNMSLPAMRSLICELLTKLR